MNCVQPGILIVVSGPSGVGKGTVCRRVISHDPNTCPSVSATTRMPRRGEKEGVHYYFLSQGEFLRRRDQGDFLEWAQVYENYYGTLKSEVEGKLVAGNNVILEIDPQGARQVRQAGDCVTVFIMPPTVDELRRRLTDRGSERGAALQLRISQAESEMALAGEYDYTIVNSNIEQAAAELSNIIAAERAKRATAE